jgi:hypothetical protein
MDKAMVTECSMGRNDGPWAMYFTAKLAMATADVTGAAFSAPPPAAGTPNPPGGWKQLIADAVRDAALAQQSIEIDEVFFADMTSLAPTPL